MGDLPIVDYSMLGLDEQCRLNFIMQSEDMIYDIVYASLLKKVFSSQKIREYNCTKKGKEIISTILNKIPLKFKIQLDNCKDNDEFDSIFNEIYDNKEFKNIMENYLGESLQLSDYMALRNFECDLRFNIDWNNFDSLGKNTYIRRNNNLVKVDEVTNNGFYRNKQLLFDIWDTEDITPIIVVKQAKLSKEEIELFVFSYLKKAYVIDFEKLFETVVEPNIKCDEFAKRKLVFKFKNSIIETLGNAWVE